MKFDEKMSELLGILQSINYDKIINNLEVASLKKWISENNKNTNPYFQEIIVKLNKILEDNEITENEKKEIIEITNKYYELGKYSIGINELLGIIEGIIADREINFAEISNLDNWLQRNTNLKGNFVYDKILELVKEVLEDGILTEEEKQKLKILLVFLLKNNDLNKQIEKLKMMVKNGDIIGNQLIELINDNAIIAKIHKEAISQLATLLKRNVSVYDVDAEIIYISLTLIALLNYDSNYYNYVEDTYSVLYDTFSEQRIEGKIRDVINRFNSDNRDEYRIISSVIRNAIVPKAYLPSFFDFIFDIYKLNFNYGINPELDLNEEFLFVYDGIKKDLDYNDDSLNLKVTNKTYYLIKTTKDLILDSSKINDLITLSISVLKIIDNYYWSNDTLNFNNEYFNYGFNAWKNKITNKKIGKTGKERETTFKSMWEPEYKINGKDIYLVIPNHKIKSYYDYKNLAIEITNDEKVVYKNECLDVFEIIGGYRIENEKILIENPLGKLRYKLLCGEEVIFDSKDRLYRDYILFNSLGNELKNNKDYEGGVVVCSLGLIDNEKVMTKCSNYVLSYFTVKVGDCLKINNDIFNFIAIQAPGILGNEKDGKCYVDNVVMPIYDEVYGLVYESENTANNIALVINGKRKHLNDLPYVIKKHGIYNNFNIIPNLDDGIYEIIFEENKGGTYNKTRQFNFIIAKDFEYNCEQVSLREYLVSITCLNKNYCKTISLNTPNISLIDFENISFDLPLNLPIFKLDNNEWQNILDSYIWIKDLNMNSKLNIFGFSCDKICVNDEEGNLLTTLYPSKDNYYYNVSISSLKSYETHKYVKLDFYDKSKKIGILYCYCECVINEKKSRFWYDEKNNEYKCALSYFGKENIYIRVLDKHENVIFEDQVLNEEAMTIEGLQSFVEYELQVISKSKGFSLSKEKMIYRKNIKYYSIADFVGKFFPIYLVSFDQGRPPIRKTRLLHNTYIEILKRVDESSFIGNVYIYKGKKIYLDKINPVEIEFTSSINDDKIEASITKDGDGLFNDFENYTILNNIDSRTAIDIFSYVIKIERK